VNRWNALIALSNIRGPFLPTTKESKMENQSQSSKLETFLFGFTRVFAIAGSIIGLIAITLLILNLLGSGESTHVALEDINTKESTKNNTVEEASAKPKKQLEIPDNVKTYLSGDNEKILQVWLDGIKGHDNKQDFLTNMSDVIADAESKEVEVFKVINNYRTLKISKLNKGEMAEYKELAQKAALYSVIFGLIIFVALMSMILVMLAIERNTRNS